MKYNLKTYILCTTFFNNILRESVLNTMNYLIFFRCLFSNFCKICKFLNWLEKTLIFKIWIHILIYKFFNIVKNREAYPEGAREFSFGECIWFCLTSLTPQGGGECPKVKIRIFLFMLGHSKGVNRLTWKLSKNV